METCDRNFFILLALILFTVVCNFCTDIDQTKRINKIEQDHAIMMQD